MNIRTANYVITRQIQKYYIPFKYQVNLPWNTPVGLPKAFERKNNWKHWIKYIKPIWCPQQRYQFECVCIHLARQRYRLSESFITIGSLCSTLQPKWVNDIFLHLLHQKLSSLQIWYTHLYSKCFKPYWFSSLLGNFLPSSVHEHMERGYQQSSPPAENLLRFFFYMFWDMNLKPGIYIW